MAATKPLTFMHDLHSVTRSVLISAAIVADVAVSTVTLMSWFISTRSFVFAKSRRCGRARCELSDNDLAVSHRFFSHLHTCPLQWFQLALWWWWWSLRSGRRMSSGLTLYFLWVLKWPTRPILVVNCRPQSSQVKRLVSADLAAGTDWLVEPFRRLRFSTAMTIRTSSKCCTPVRQAFCHLDLLPARSSQVAGSMPVDSRLALSCLWSTAVVGSWAGCPTATLRRR